MWSELKVFPSLAELLYRYIFLSPVWISCPKWVLNKFQRTSRYLSLLQTREKSDGEISQWCQYYGDLGPNNCLLANTFKSTVLGPTIVDKGVLLHLTRARFNTLSTWALWLLK